MSQHDETSTDILYPQRPQQEEAPRSDVPEHMKPENVERLRNYNKDGIPPGVA
ncbi:hypothetical protein [Pseudomonas oligotrophica]|uniref:hypothetical protein n=1 Tax=Pseudomonas oligotrophica TaxID=2912055 RepID=UPI001F185BB4|nr:hypothetical protein [Pseudomonas oligotrophica]MCF7203218.1 hypothetical protein [Pseudomonas oligotrophica]